MSIYTDKVLLIIGGEEIVDASYVEKNLSEGAREVRILGESEIALQLFRESFNTKPLTLNQKLRLFVGDVADNAYIAEAMSDADYLLYTPSLPRVFDREVAHA